MLKTDKGLALMTALVMVFLLSLAAAAIMIMNVQQAEITKGTIDHRITLYLVEAATVVTRERIKKGDLVTGTYDIITTGPTNPPDIDVVAQPNANRLGTVTVGAEGATPFGSVVRELNVSIDPDDPSITTLSEFNRFL